jgi:hypothetical protein
MSRFHVTAISGLFLVLALATVTGCDQSVDDGSTDAHGDAAKSRVVTVEWNGTSRDVDPDELPPDVAPDPRGARLSRVVAAAFPDLDLADIASDFEASDGFRPGSSPNCDGLVPVAGLTLERGFIEPATGNLSWDDELGYPGCLKVRDLAKILLQDVAGDGN